MIERNRVGISRAIRAIDYFVDHGGSIEDLQSTLESCRLVLEGGDSAVKTEIFYAVEGLEGILFGRLASEQFSEAVLLLKPVREFLRSELLSEED